MNTHNLLIPDIGDFSEVNVAEVLIKAGDNVNQGDSLIILESDKASMEIPSDYTGRISQVNIKVGDKVSQGDLIATIEIVAGSEPKERQSKDRQTPDGNTSHSEESEKAELVVLGAGPGGYSAAFRAADLGLSVTLIERYPTLGGVCLNVGCIPSKALLHVTGLMAEVKNLAHCGVRFAAPEIDIDALRKHKETIVGKLTGGLAGMAKARKINIIRGVAKISGKHSLQVIDENGQSRDIHFQKLIIAAGSEAVKLPFLPEDPRIIDSTGALALPFIPKRMLVIGGGIIGLEMATVYNALGAKIDIVEMMDHLMAGADADLVKVWKKRNPFNRIMLKTATVAAQAREDAIYVRFEGEQAPEEEQPYDLVLVAVGRRPNGKNIGAENAGVHIDERGFIPVDKQMRSNQAHIYAIGDIVGQPMLAHKAVHEAHVAAEAAAGEKAYFDARVIPSVAYTDPEVAWVGVSEQQSEKGAIKKAVFPWMASGRALANGCEDGFTKLIIDPQTNHIIGGAIVGPNAGDMIGEIALAIEMNATVEDIALTIHPHPTLGESIGMAAEVACGSCTDLPPQRK